MRLVFVNNFGFISQLMDVSGKLHIEFTLNMNEALQMPLRDKLHPYYNGATLLMRYVGKMYGDSNINLIGINPSIGNELN